MTFLKKAIPYTTYSPFHILGMTFFRNVIPVARECLSQVHGMTFRKKVIPTPLSPYDLAFESHTYISHLLHTHKHTHDIVALLRFFQVFASKLAGYFNSSP